MSGAYLDDREIAKLALTEPLRFIDLAGIGSLASIGADNLLTTGSYRVVQLWSAALKKHPCRPDGIRYRSRHAPERIALAIYERSTSSFERTNMGSFTAPANDALFKSVLKTYKFALL